MVEAIRANYSGITRPGVFVNQTYTGGVPQPLASHAIGYIFASTEADEFRSFKYSELTPYKPTQITSVSDYVRKIGGVPTKDKASAISYHAVKAFFDNVGNNGILYATRVTSTPEVLVDIPVGLGYRLFTLKINGRYFGSFDMDTVDGEGVPIKAILTSGLDELDNAYDVFEYLENVDPDFSTFYMIERTSTEATNAKFRIYSKAQNALPIIESFYAYKLLDSTTPNLSTDVVNILNDYPDAVKAYYPVKNLGIRLNSKVNGLGIAYVSGYALAQYNAAQSVPLTMNTATDTQLSTLFRAYIASIGLTLAATQIVAISEDTINSVVGVKWPVANSGYLTYATTGDLTFGDAVPTGNTVARTGYLPVSVQTAYVNIAGESRVLIANGGTPTELAQGFADAIAEVFEEKGLAEYYDIEPEVITYSNPAAIVPNNGYSLTSGTLANHGYPNIKPAINADGSPLTLSASSVISGGSGNVRDLVSSGGFLIAPYPGMLVYRNGVRLSVVAVTNATTVTVTSLSNTQPDLDAVARSVFVDASEANGFYIYDYVANVKITSKNGTTPPVFPGLNRSGLPDENVVLISDSSEILGFESYKFSVQSTKAADYAYAIRQGLTSEYYSPGYIFAPEAFTTLVTDGDTYTKADALQDRLKVISAISAVASGSVQGEVSGFDNATQFVGFIDCGADIKNVAEASEELTKIKSTVGSPLGHLAYYAPHVLNEEDVYVPASAYAVGIACSRNITEGFQQPPAGVRYPLRGAIGLKFPISAQQQEVTYALGLNPIRSLPNKGIVIWGARTLSSIALFKFINTRVILNVLIDALSRSFDDILFEQIDSAGTIYSRVVSIAVAILNQLFRQGALFGNRPEQAYAVVCNDSNNTPELLEQGTVGCDIYVATSPTLERILISVARTPAGQVAMINDSFSRNIARFQSAIQTQNLTN